ncbi:hypothetical protein [Pedobacter nototheniae]|uniref:hypothetical protein n=1 Tax=Pedobacter nototheniae TaxID=2488994 RepID=UPI0013F3D3EC|nr:hypothetical protein [Pedobacter nototheniae]
MVVQTVLRPGSKLQSPEGIINVLSYSGGIYDLEANGHTLLMDESSLNHLIEERVWVVQ